MSTFSALLAFLRLLANIPPCFNHKFTKNKDINKKSYTISITTIFVDISIDIKLKYEFDKWQDVIDTIMYISLFTENKPMLKKPIVNASEIRRVCVHKSSRSQSINDCMSLRRG